MAKRAPGTFCFIAASGVPKEKQTTTTNGRLLLVDLKGIEPSNLTDANRALSQLSYRPKCTLHYKANHLICKEYFWDIF